MSKSVQAISKDYWMSKRSVKTCFKCDKPFRTFRIKYHCNYCGLVFCSFCTKKRFRLSETIELKRCCESCILSLRRIGSSDPASIQASDYSIASESQSMEPELPVQNPRETIEKHKPISSHKMKELVHEFSEPFNNTWDQATEDYFIQNAEAIIRQAGDSMLSEDWLPIIINLVRQAVIAVCPSVHFRRDKMNINDYIRIVKAESPDINASKFVQGIVIQKNVAHKHMVSRISDPKILFVRGGTEYSEGNSQLVSIDKLITQEEELIDILIKKIKQLNANVVINESTISQAAINRLADIRVTAFIKIKSKDLKILARCTQAQILESVDRVSSRHHFLGNCSSIHREVYGGKSYIFFQDPTDTSLAGSILVAGPNRDELKKVKAVIKQLLVAYRNAIIEKHLFQLCQLELTPDLFVNLNSTCLNANELTLNGNMMCSSPAPIDIEFYSENDISLGDFISSVTRKTEEPCEKDPDHVVGNHTIYYINSGGRISVNIRSSSEEDAQDITLSKECKGCAYSKRFMIVLSRVMWEYSFFKFLANMLSSYDFFRENRPCKHEYFKFSRFIFRTKRKQVIIEYEPEQIYSFVQAQPQNTFKQYQLLCQKAEARFEDACLKTFNGLQKICKDIILMQSNDILSEENIGKRQSWELLREESTQINDQIAGSLGSLKHICDLSSQKEIESFKQMLFIRACTIKIQIDNIKSLSRKIKSGKISHIQPTCIKRKLTEAFLLPSEETVDITKAKTPTVITEKDDDFLNSLHFTYLRGANLTLPIGVQSVYIPVDDNDSFSLVCYALNSVPYHDKVTKRLPDTEVHEVIETELLRGNEEHFTHVFSTFDDAELSEIAQNSESSKVFGHNISYQVKVYYPRQFHCIRLHACGSPLDFLRSIACSFSTPVTLGKKGAFKYSHDNKYILKSIGEKEFKMFLDIAPNYFRHVCKTIYHSMPSFLVKTLGAFKVHVKNHTTQKNKVELILVYENLLFKLPPPVHCYDLKGTTNQRRRVKEGDGKTKMDLNFIEDFNGIPIALSSETKRFLDTGIWNDTIFLAKQNIVDYSLLLAISLEHKKIAVGVIDYVEQYTLEKALEYKYKKYMNNDIPTITNTKVYKERFRSQVLQKYFLAVNN